MENQTDFAVVSPTGGVANIDPSNLARQAFTTKEQINSFALDNQAEGKFSTGPFQHTTLFGIDYRNAVDTALNGQALTGVPSINAFNPVYGLPLPAIAFASNNKQRIDQLGFYAQDQIKFDRWVALLGVRHDQANNETSNLVTGATTATISDHAVTKRGALSTNSTMASHPTSSPRNRFSRPPAPTSPTSPSIRREASSRKPASNINPIRTA
jgi:iron complex outermembrane receptor protein